MSKLLDTDIHTLADIKRFNNPGSPTRMTLDSVPDEWVATFERTKTQADWDRLLKYCQRMPNHIYIAARKACAGRDSHSQKIAASRHRAADILDSI